jgi:hypothetical protein
MWEFLGTNHDSTAKIPLLRSEKGYLGGQLSCPSPKSTLFQVPSAKRARWY